MMKSEEEISEAQELAETMAERYEEADRNIEGIGVGVIEKTLGWVLETDEHDTLLEDLREDVEETEGGM
jgi:hypothetical protein